MKLKSTMKLVLAGVIGLFATQAEAQMRFTASTLTRTQNFNGLPTTGGTLDSAIIGQDWFHSQTSTGGGQGFTGTAQGGATISGGLSGGVYNAGSSSSSTDRSVGLVGSGSVEASIGVQLINNTGAAVSGFSISAAIEKYRNGSSSAQTEILTFEYSTNATSVTTGTWVGVTALNLTEPSNANTSATTFIDGNLTANKGTSTGSITGLTLANGSSIWIRWRDEDNTGTDALLAVDDVSITAVAAACTPTVTIASTAPSTICANQSLAFTSSITNGGTTPAYQWISSVDGNIAGATNSTYTAPAGTVTTGEQFTLKLTSNAACASANPTVTSSAISRTVTATVAPSVTIAPATNSTVCTGTAVNFTATPTNGGTTPTYQWFVNNVASGTGSTFSLNTPTAGAYVVGVTLTSNATCISQTTAQSANTTVTATNPITPTANISASPSQNICAGQQVTFSANSNASAPVQTLSYSWLLNGSPVATTATYSSNTLNNNDIVQLNLTVNGCVVNAPNTVQSNSIQVGVTSQFVPTVNISASNNGAAICSGTNVTFTASAFPSTNVTYQWVKNGSNVGTNSFQYSDAALNNGDQVYVIATSSSPCATAPGTSTPITINVNATVTPSVTIDGANGVICFGTPSTFTATGTGLGSTPVYTWYRNDTVEAVTNVPTLEVAKVSVYNPETFEVVVSNINTACATTTTVSSNEISRQAVATPQPSVTITDGSLKLCQGQGQQVTFTLKTQDANGNPINTNPTDLQWTVNGSNIPNATTGTYTATTAGNYQLVLTAQNTTCTRTSTLYEVTENPLPTQNVLVQGATTFCAGSSVTLSADSAAGYQIRWKQDGTTRSTRASYVAKAGGNYTVSTTLNGCTVTSAPVAVDVTPAPVTTITPVGPIFLCDGSSTTISAVADGNYTYTWYDANTPLGLTTSSINVTASGRYRAAISNSGCPAKFTPAVAVTQSATPVATIALQSSTANSRYLRATGGGGLTYQWFENGNAVPGATERYFTAASNGSYTVAVSRNQCADTSDAYAVAGLRMVAATGIEATPVMVYPNPSSSVFNIGYDQAVNVIVKDLQGRIIMDVRNASKVDMNGQASGLYMMEIFNQSGNLIQVERLMKN